MVVSILLTLLTILRRFLVRLITVRLVRGLTYVSFLLIHYFQYLSNVRDYIGILGA